MLRYSSEVCRWLLKSEDQAAAAHVLADIGFTDRCDALTRMRRLAATDAERSGLVELLPAILLGLESAHTPDQALLNLERFVRSVPDRAALFHSLAESPRQVEILLRLFVSSQFLTDILTRDRSALDRLTHHQRLAEIKLPPQLLAEAREAAAGHPAAVAQLNALRRFQQGEILRIAACDTFHLLDLRTVTEQLSRLADAIVQCSLDVVAADIGAAADDLAVVAFGKLGAEELNYSSDIDLVFLTDCDAERHWKLGQRLISALGDASGVGFLYRVDMRLRPWGKSGPLVTTPAGYLEYLRTHARPWELQALIKARTIAGNAEVGDAFLSYAQTFAYELPGEVARKNITDMLSTLSPPGANAEAQVKTGPGGIREIEFVTQYLQIVHGRECRRTRRRSTLDALTALADAELILPGEFQHLRGAYIFQRSVEHSLQLTHNRQSYRLPDEPRELERLAARLDFPSADQFLAHYSAHRRFAHEIADRHLRPRTEPDVVVSRPLQPGPSQVTRPVYSDVFNSEVRRRHADLLARLTPEEVVCVELAPLTDNQCELTVAGLDQLGDLSLICGLLFARGCDIIAGHAFTGVDRPTTLSDSTGDDADDTRPRMFVNVFRVRTPQAIPNSGFWQDYESDLRMLFGLATEGRLDAAQGWLARQLTKPGTRHPTPATRPQPVEIAIDNSRAPDATMMQIRGEDTPGFLYELCNALALSHISIQSMLIQTSGPMVSDTLTVTTAEGRKITDRNRLQELRAAVVLTKQFTHLLADSANPSAALSHFRTLLSDLFRQDRWLDQLASLQQPEVLRALAQLLGDSDFLWEDFLRLNHAELFPLIADQQALAEAHDLPRLQADLTRAIDAAGIPEEQRRALNSFKDREMFRIDMRHILGLQREFGQFSRELTWLAEAVCGQALQLCIAELRSRYGQPLTDAGDPVRMTLCALGKCGGEELGFASDIELMFLYDGEGATDGPEGISAVEFFNRLTELLQQSIQARQKGVFEIDVRLRPFGNAGAPAVAWEAFERYYRPEGPAWPFERQALVKLRPIAGDDNFGAEIVRLRDQLIYTGESYDLAAMRGMRERQIRELVRAGRFNAKLSPGGLVDCEYFVQALQITFGDEHPALRTPNTRAALRALEQIGILPDRLPLRNAYRFLRRLIDALRMVRGDARDLHVPPEGSDAFEFLTRRLDRHLAGERLADEIDRHSQIVLEHMQRLEDLIAPGGA